MKKLLLILLAVSITATTFAIDFSAQVIGSADILYGDSTHDGTKKWDDLYMGRLIRGRVRLEATADKDNFGGWARLQADPGNLEGFGYVYVKPTENVSFYLTRNPDGHWGLDGGARWGFYGPAGDVFLIESWKFGAAFYGGFSNGGFFTFTPTEAITVNVGLNVFEDNNNINNLITNAVFQFKYDLGDKGLIGLTVIGNEGDAFEDAGGTYNPTASLRLYYGIKNLDFGIGYRFPTSNPAGGDDVHNYPLTVGFAGNFAINEGVNVKTRLMMDIFGNTSIEDTDGSRKLGFHPITVIWDILPSIAIAENFTFYFNAGVDLEIPPPHTPNTVFNWHLNPYIVIGDMGSAAFYMGIRLDGNYKRPAPGVKHDDRLEWSIPIGFSFNF